MSLLTAAAAATRRRGVSGGYVFPPPGAQWSAGHETGDDSEWVSGQGTWYVQPSGTRDFGVLNTGPAKTGSWAYWMEINAPSGSSSGVRLFRTEEQKTNQLNRVGTYHSVWIYIPQHITVNGWWNIIQQKSTIREADGTNLENDPVWALHVNNRASDGAMFLILVDKVGEHILKDASLNNEYTQELVDMPVDQWFHIESFIFSEDPHNYQYNIGRVMFWQDGVLLWDKDGVRTMHDPNDYPTADPSRCSVGWAVNLYAQNLVNGDNGTNTVEMWVDDVAVDDSRIGPTGAGA